MSGPTLAEIVARLGGVLKGDGQLRVHRVGPMESAIAGEITFLTNPRYRSHLATTAASAVILAPDMVPLCPVASIATPNPYLYFARLAQWLAPPVRPAAGIHPSAVVEAQLPADAAVGPGACIGADAKIGADVVIGAGCVIGAGVEIGDGSMLHPNVTVYAGSRIGKRAVIHAGAVIGSDGFGFAQDQDAAWVKIPQTGRVLIGDDVEIGANTTIDRGAIEDTVIEEGVKLDNQIQVAHNVHIGAHTAIAGCVGIAGSTRIGRRCTFGGAAMIIGHLNIADDVHITAGTLLVKSIAKPGRYSGSVPTLEYAAWLKNFAHLRHLDEMADKIRALERRLAELEKKP